MEVSELTSLGVIAGPANIDRLAAALKEAGRWSLVPIEWPDPVAVVAVRQSVHAYVVNAEGIASPFELIELLRSRRDDTPLVVVGGELLKRAEPDFWLPTLGKPAVLASALAQLLVREDSGATLAA